MIVIVLGFGMTELAAVLAVVINKAPLIAVNVRDGVRQFESGTKNLRKSTSCLVQKLRLVWIPQLEPFLFTALRTGLSLTWKIILSSSCLEGHQVSGSRYISIFNSLRST